MKAKSSINPFCLVFGHNYFRIGSPDSNEDSVFCKSCEKEFKCTKNGNIIEIPSREYMFFSKKKFFKTK